VVWASPKHEYAQEQFMKRKGLLLLVLAALVAGAAFAQKVGDTANVFGKNYTVKDIRDGEVILMLTPTLDGTWKNGAGTVSTINSNTGVYKQFPSSPSALLKSAINKGYVKVGTQMLRNLKKMGDLTWAGQQLAIAWNNSDTNTATGTGWVDSTITLSADGKTFTVNGDTWTRQ
jgi:uncharacterized protein (DUF2147 family)